MCRHGARRPFTLSAAGRRSSSTAGGTWAPTTSRLARKSGSSRASAAIFRCPRPSSARTRVSHHRAWPGPAGLRHSRDRQGDISLAPDTTTNAHIAWSYARDGAHMISPVLYRGLLYVSKNNGTFSVFDAVTEKAYQERLGDGTTGFTASLVAADGKVLHQRRWRRLCGEGGPHLRAPVEEPARRLRDGDARNRQRHALLQDRRGGHRGEVGGVRVSGRTFRSGRHAGFKTRPPEDLRTLPRRHVAIPDAAIDLPKSN